jgi:hypothetical protein
MLATLLATKTAAAGIAFVAVTATAAAAYTGSLPTTLQNAAHHSVHAPAAHHNHKVDADGKRFTPGPKPTPTPTATPSHPAFRKHHLSPAEAHGLCTAFIKGGPPVPDTARQKLSDEAGDATKIKAFCALVLKHPPYPHPTFTPPIHPTGKPIPFPAVRPTVFPTEAA